MKRKWTDCLTEDDVTAVLHGEAAGDGGGTVLHQQEHHGLLGLVTHQGHAVGQRGEQRVQSLAPLACTKRGFGKWAELIVFKYLNSVPEVQKRQVFRF